MMKKKVVTFSMAIAFLGVSCTDQQILSTINTAGEVLGNEEASNPLSNQEVVAGLREALNLGAEHAASIGSAVDGFNANPRIHIPFPEDAIKVKNTVEDLGMGNQVDKFVTTLNRAAEDASREAAPIFLDAIKGMSIQDGFQILKGEEDAASTYLREKTYDKLYATFKPEVQKAVSKVKVGENWTPLANAYNTATLLTGGEKVDPNLNDYVTAKAIDGLFLLLEDEEKKIRENPAARVTDLLKKVFGSLD